MNLNAAYRANPTVDPSLTNPDPAESAGNRPFEILTAAYLAIGLPAREAAAWARADFDCIFGAEDHPDAPTLTPGTA